jgi:hypothetical protein
MLCLEKILGNVICLAKVLSLGRILPRGAGGIKPEAFSRIKKYRYCGGTPGNRTSDGTSDVHWVLVGAQFQFPKAHKNSSPPKGAVYPILTTNALPFRKLTTSPS